MISMTYQVTANDFLRAGAVSSQIKQTCKQLLIPNDILRRLAISCYEAEINMIIHSLGGEITLMIDPDQRFLQLTFQDCGPGIEDLELAMKPGFSTASDKAREFGFGAGMGLPNIRHNSDEFEIDSSPAGTCVKVRFSL